MAMATSSSSSTSLYPIPTQQPQQPLVGNEIQPTATNANLVAAPSSPSHNNSSGSIGPFFAVISVIVVLALLSCYLGRICAKRRQKTALVAEVNPLDMIKSGGVLGWLRRKWRRCLAGDVEAGAKVADCAGKETPKDSGQDRLEAPPA